MRKEDAPRLVRLDAVARHELYGADGAELPSGRRGRPSTAQAHCHRYEKRGTTKEGQRRGRRRPGVCLALSRLAEAAEMDEADRGRQVRLAGGMPSATVVS